MTFEKIADDLVAHEEGVEHSTMMKTSCLRYRGAFLAMMFSKGDGLIVKVSPERVNELIEEGIGEEFNFTRKRFKEWVLIPTKHSRRYRRYVGEALEYARSK